MKDEKTKGSHWSQNCEGIEGVSIGQILPAMKCLYI